MNWCLPPNLVDSFKKAILSGRIDPAKLAEMSSVERRGVFAKELGRGHAEQINSEFESKLLLKNQQQGYISWAKKVLGETSPAGRDVISRIQRMETLLSPKEEAAFLEDLTKRRLGVGVSYDEAKTIADLTKKLDEGKAKMEAGGDRIETYGQALVNLKRYVGDLKAQAGRMGLEDFRNRPILSVIKTAWEGVKISKALKAAWDNSAIYRPGNKIMLTNPTAWAKRAFKSFKDIWDTFGNKEVLNLLDADLLSRENALNGYYKKAGLDIGITEEAYPSDVPERAMGYVGEKIEQTKIPIVSKVVGRAVGKTYKASQDAYTSFTRGARADVFDKTIDIAKRTGVELDDVQLKAIGRMVNSLTARGRLGSLERAGEATNIGFFSPKMLKSHVDVLLEPISGGGGGFTGFKGSEPGTAFVRKQAAMNLLKIVGGTAAMLAMAKAVKDDSVDFDPRSANFGKIKVGNTRFDMTGGFASLSVLAARLATGKTKGSTTGEVRAFNERDEEGNIKFGAPTRKDAIYDFFENKLSPPAAVVKDIAQGETRAGEKPSVWTTVRDLYEPLPLSNYRELKNDPKSAPKLLAIIADGLGVATNTYGATPKQEESFRERQRQERKSSLTERRRRGEDVSKESEGLVRQSLLRPQDVGDIEQDAKLTRGQLKFKAKSLPDALTEYEGMDESHRREVKQILSEKSANVDDLLLSQQTDVKRRLEALGLKEGRPIIRRPRPERPRMLTHPRTQWQ